MPSLPNLDWELLPPDQRIMIAASGGADSMALLREVAANGPAESIVAAHVNHGTRGAESEGDQQFVRDFCQQYDIDFVAQSLSLSDHSEAVMRQARYGALREMARQQHCARVATAHTASDVLESVLLHFLRDASIVGWRGIANKRALDEKVLLVRPLLNTTRQEIRHYLEAHHQSWREDSSNKSTFYRRNAVRKQLLPVIEELVPGGVEQLSRQASRMTLITRDEQDYWESHTRQLWDELQIETQQHLVILDGRKFQQLHPACQRRVLRFVPRYFGRDLMQINFARVEEARRHITKDGRNAVWQWRGGISVHWTAKDGGRRIRISVAR